ncbi:MAG TPA: hypothetical protein VGO86_08730 [Candidatus Dormibacteraeota bacterium]
MVSVDAQPSTQHPPRTARPFILEFAGTPRAGKTSALSVLRGQLEAAGYRVGVVGELARLSPVPTKRDPDFNIWTVTTTVSRMVEAIHAEGQVILVDRGVLDAMCWMDWHLRSGRLARKEWTAIDRFLLTRSLARMADLVLLMTVTPAQAVARDIASGRDRSGSVIVGQHVLGAFNRSVESVRQRHAGRLPIVHIDTTDLDQAATLQRISTEVTARLSRRTDLVPTPLDPSEARSPSP